MSLRLPARLADPDPAPGRLWLTNARLFDGTGAAVRDGAAVLVEDGRITLTGEATGGVPEGAAVLDLGGRTLMPGLIDAHTHLKADLPKPADGSEPLWPDLSSHFLASALRDALRLGVTTMRDVGSIGDHLVTARQAMRYGAFRGPRVLTCGRIVSPTSPGGRFFDGMYREADGPDEMRKAVREQARRGADFVKFMSTGARSVELEDPEPAQLTGAEVAALVDEAHRLGYRVCAHAEGLAGTELAVTHGADTIEHGMYLHRRPDLLDAMAEAGQFLVPTLSCYYGIAGFGDAVGAPAPTPAPTADAPTSGGTQPGGGAAGGAAASGGTLPGGVGAGSGGTRSGGGAAGGAAVSGGTLPGDVGAGSGGMQPGGGAAGGWTRPLVELAVGNLVDGEKTLRAAKAAGVPIAMGCDWHPITNSALEIVRMVHHGLTGSEALAAATSGGAAALGLDDEIGTVTTGRLADLIVVDGDPVTDPALLRDRARIWLVLQSGHPVTGTALEAPLPTTT